MSQTKQQSKRNSDLEELLKLFSLGEYNPTNIQQTLRNLRVSLAFVVKIDLSTAETLKQCIQASGARLIYQKASLQNLYITLRNPTQ